jgi:alpha-N-arabinofuranosidase
MLLDLSTMKKQLTIILTFLCVQLTHSQNIPGASANLSPNVTSKFTTITNPVLAGFYPDPSVLKVGADYYLINSTFAYFPGIPVFHSKDLKNWKQIGNVISRPSQMNFMGHRMTRGLFAPAIDYHNGIYYVTCTLIDRGGNFIVTAKNPAGPWSDPVWLPEVKGIDPSLYFENDKAYIVYNSDAPDNNPLYPGHRTIRIYEFDYASLKVIGEERILVNGGVDLSKKPVWIEGPHFIKRNGWYYLYAAEGGTSVNHSQVVFRSRSMQGPFVPYATRSAAGSKTPGYLCRARPVCRRTRWKHVRYISRSETLCR